MQPRKRCEKVAVARSGIGHARGPEQEAVRRGERGDEDRHGHDERCGMARRPFDRKRSDERRVRDIGQRQRREDAEVECHIRDAYGDDRQHHSARNRAHRGDHLIAELRDAVVAAVVIERVHHRRAEPGDAQTVERKGRREQGRNRLRRVDEAGGGDREQGEHGDRAERERGVRDVRNRPVEREQRHHADGERDAVANDRLRCRGNDIRRVLREADVSARQRERNEEQQLPNEEKGRQPSRPVCAEGFAQVRIRAAAARKARTQLGKAQPVAECDDCARDPRPHRDRPVHRRNDQRNRDQRAGADHRRDVDCDGAAQPDAANQAVNPNTSR